MTIYSLSGSEENKYETLRLKPIEINYLHQNELKIKNNHEFNTLLEERKNSFIDCSKSIDLNFCKYKERIRSQNILIGNIVSKGGSIEETHKILKDYKEDDYIFSKG